MGDFWQSNDDGGVGTQRSRRLVRSLETDGSESDGLLKRELVTTHYKGRTRPSSCMATCGLCRHWQPPRWGKGDVFFVRRGAGSTAAEGEPGYGNSAYGSDNKFRTITFWLFNSLVGVVLQVTDIDTTSVPEGRAGGYYYEVFGDAENQPRQD